MLKKFLLLVLAMMLCAGAAMAGEKQHTWTADFDRDGETEMFVLTGEDKALYTMGNLVYVDGDRTVDVMMGAGFKVEDCCVWEMEDTVLFKAEESYGIGGTVSYVYSIENGEVVRANGMFRGLTHIGGNQFYYWHQDTDLRTDRSGNTLKPYYVHWTDGYFFEMGGIYVSSEQVAAWPEGKRALEWIGQNGFMVKTILYHENGILNISYSDNIVNGNCTLQYEENDLYILNTRLKPTDMPEDSNFGGTFQTMTGNSRYVTFPQAEFPQPAE